MRADHVAACVRCEAGGDHCRRCCVEAVDDDDSTAGSRAEDRACETAKLETAHLRQDIESVGRVGAVDGERIGDGFRLDDHTRIADACAAACHRLGCESCEGGADRGR